MFRLISVFSASVLLAASAASGACSSPPGKRVPWEDESRLKTEHFIVYAEPSLKNEEFALQIRNAEETWNSYESYLFPGTGRKKLRILIYRNQKSYSHYRMLPIDSVADYERRKNRMNISLDAAYSVWKHELSHAMLESVRPGSPYWLHEGLALFLQNENFEGIPGCRNPIRTSMPDSLAQFLPALRKKEIVYPGKEFVPGPGSAPDIPHASAGYFIFYLWEKKLLLHFLAEYGNSRRSAESVLKKISGMDEKEISSSYTEWLHSAGPLLSLKGC